MKPIGTIETKVGLLIILIVVAIFVFAVFTVMSDFSQSINDSDSNKIYKQQNKEEHEFKN